MFGVGLDELSLSQLNAVEEALDRVTKQVAEAKFNLTLKQNNELASELARTQAQLQSLQHFVVGLSAAQPQHQLMALNSPSPQHAFAPQQQPPASKPSEP
jgi:hypothetical protein